MPFFQGKAGTFPLPRIDMAATGRNIDRLRRAAGFSVRELQSALALSSPQAVYKWLRGEALPSLDNLLALSRLLGAAMEEILVCASSEGGEEEGGRAL